MTNQAKTILHTTNRLFLIRRVKSEPKMQK